MITDKSKNIFKIATLFLIVALAFGIFWFCTKDDDSAPSGEFLSGEPSAWNRESPYDKYAVVLPINCSGEVYSAAEALAAKLAENTGAACELFYSYESTPSGKRVCHIFLGDTGDEASTKYLGKFRAEDKGYRFRDDAVHIGGRTEESLLSAIELFKSEVVVYADKEFFMNDGKEVFMPAEYEVSAIKLAGVSIGEYTLVYPQDNIELLAIAEEFRDAVLEASDFYMSIKADSDVARGTRAIILGDCKLTGISVPDAYLDRATVTTYSSGIMILCERNFGIRYALDDLLNKLLDLDESKSSDVRIDAYDEYVFEAESTDIFTLCANKEELSFDELILAIEVVRDHQSDIYRIEGMSDSSVQYIFNQFSDEYNLTKISDGKHMMTLKNVRVERVDANGVVFTDHITSSSNVLRIIDLLDKDDLDIDALRENSSVPFLVFSNKDKSEVENIFSFTDAFWHIDVNDEGAVASSEAFVSGEWMWVDNTYASSEGEFYYSGFSLTVAYTD